MDYRREIEKKLVAKVGLDETPVVTAFLRLLKSAGAKHPKRRSQPSYSTKITTYYDTSEMTMLGRTETMRQTFGGDLERPFALQHKAGPPTARRESLPLRYDEIVPVSSVPRELRLDDVYAGVVEVLTTRSVHAKWALGRRLIGYPLEAKLDHVFVKGRHVFTELEFELACADEACVAAHARLEQLVARLPAVGLPRLCAVPVQKYAHAVYLGRPELRDRIAPAERVELDDLYGGYTERAA